MNTIAEILPLTETLTPGDEAAVVDAVRHAYRDGTPIYPIGGGTHLDFGTRPTRPGVGLALGRLNRVVDHPADDMTITVEAGVTMAELGRRLRAEKQRLPVDVARADRATVGGVVATDPSGPRQFAAGTIRDYLLGFRAVDGRGTPFAAGGRVVKNVAGYNLSRLMTGSLGTLGVITQVTLMARPMPEASAIVACDVPDFAAAERLLAALVRTETDPAAVELHAGADERAKPLLGALPESSVARLFVGFESSREEVNWMVGQLRLEWEALDVAPPTIVSHAQVEPLWQWLADFDAQLQVNVLPGATVAAIERVLDAVPGCSIRSRAGNGVILIRLSSLGPEEFVTAVRTQLRPAIAQCGGHLVVRSYPDGAALTGEDVWGPPADGAAVMRAVKDRFDPDGLLNPGRFVFD
ncbi:MAG: FAD-binding oxidoreductase [Candidatus Nealsonbacteria bacterium]|nr:FAD-binding oxidoreductase [Candidatus Nealsonbacteria bacterium]